MNCLCITVCFSTSKEIIGKAKSKTCAKGFNRELMNPMQCIRTCNDVVISKARSYPHYPIMEQNHYPNQCWILIDQAHKNTVCRIFLYKTIPMKDPYLSKTAVCDMWAYPREIHKPFLLPISISITLVKTIALLRFALSTKWEIIRYCACSADEIEPKSFLAIRLTAMATSPRHLNRSYHFWFITLI